MCPPSPFCHPWKNKEWSRCSPIPFCHPLTVLAETGSPCLIACRAFFEDTVRAGEVVNQVEMFVAHVTELLGYIFYQLMRNFVVAVILMPFIGLIQHARREPSVDEVRH